MATVDRFVRDVLREEGDILITRQGREISARTKSRTGNLISGRSVTTTDDRLSFTHPIYERFLDMKVKGRKRRKIHNRFIFGTYATIADKLMNGIRERVADELKQINR